MKTQRVGLPWFLILLTTILIFSAGTGVASHVASPAVPAQGTITASGPTSVSFQASNRAGAATGTGDCGLVPGNCSSFLLTVGNPGGKNVRVRLDWMFATNDYDMGVFKQGPGTAESQVSSSGNGTTTFEEAVFTPEANTTYQIVIVHFAALPGDNIVGSASLVNPPLVVEPKRIGPKNTGILFSPNGNITTNAGEAPTGLGTVMAPEAARDGEPSIRADLHGNVYPAGIRGVPAGVDVWRFGPNAYCPRFAFHRSNDFFAPLSDPPSNPANPAAGYVWLGQPDGIFVTRGEGSPDAGGGDIEIATSIPGNPLTVPTLSMVSLTLANITSSRSWDRGNTWSPANPTAATVPLDDRQWIDSYGPNTVYLYYRTLATLTGLVLNKSVDGGVTYAASTSLVNPLGFTPGWIDVDQTPNSDGSVNIYLSAQNSSELAVFRCVDPTPNAPGPISCTQSIVDNTMSHGHIFDVVSVDNAGNVYAAWSNNQDIFYAYSTNKGATWSAPVRVTAAGTGHDMPNFNFFPWLTAGDDGRIGIVWYGTDKTTNADEDAEWKTYYAFSANARAARPTVRWLEASDHVIHKSNVSQAGLSTDAAVNRNLIDFFQVAHDPRDGAAVIAFADDHNDFDGHTYYTRQISGPGLRKDRRPTQPFCPSLTPLRNPEVLDFLGDATGVGATLPVSLPDADILSMDYGWEKVGPDLFLTVDIETAALVSVPLERSYRAYFAVNTRRGLLDSGNQYFLEVTTEGGTPQFFLGVAARTSAGGTREVRTAEDIAGDQSGPPFQFGTPGKVRLRVNVSRLDYSFGATGTEVKGGSTPPSSGSLVIGLRGRSAVQTLATRTLRDQTRGGSFIILGAPNPRSEGEDDDDFDHDGVRDDLDADDDNDGVNDGLDDDDDNDGINNDADADDDNDGIADLLDGESTRDLQSAISGELAIGDQSDYVVTVDAETLSLTASLAAADPSQTPGLRIEIYTPAGVLVATSSFTSAGVVVSTPSLLPGTYTVRVRNTGSGAISYSGALATSHRWL